MRRRFIPGCIHAGKATEISSFSVAFAALSLPGISGSVAALIASTRALRSDVKPC